MTQKGLSLLCHFAKKQYLRGRIGFILFALVVQWIERKFPKL